MRLLLINPGRIKGSEATLMDFNFEKKVLNLTDLIPLYVPTIAGVTPEDVETTIVDEKIEEINFDEKVDLVGIGGMTHNIKRAYEIAGEFRERGVTVIIGGIHASMMPEEALVHADSIVIGEADDVWAGVIEDFKEGRLKEFYHSEVYPDMEKLPSPRYDLLKSDRYVMNQVQTARGCPFDCDFCSVKAFSGEKFRLKKIEQVISEIESFTPYYIMDAFGYKLKLPKSLLIADDNIIGNKKYSRKLFETMISRKLPGKYDWHCQASVNVGRDKEMLALMKEAGCNSMIIGIESIVEDSVAELGKKINNVDKYYECLDNIHSAGIKVYGSFILGNDHEDDSIFEKTVKFIKNTNLVYCMINVLTPLPGTRLYKRLASEGRILHKEWEKYNLESVVFQPKNMSVETLDKGRRWICQEIYSLDAIHNRFEKFLEQKDHKEVKGYEDAWKGTSIAHKFFSWLMMTRIFYNINSEQRRYLFNMLRRYFEGKETHFGHTIATISFNDYAFNL